MSTLYRKLEVGEKLQEGDRISWGHTAYPGAIVDSRDWYFRPVPSPEPEQKKDMNKEKRYTAVVKLPEYAGKVKLPIEYISLSTITPKLLITQEIWELQNERIVVFPTDYRWIWKSTEPVHALWSDDWLTDIKEIKDEPEVDWSKIKEDARCFVRGSEFEQWRKAHFARTYFNTPVFYQDGTSSWTSKIPCILWKYYKLADESEEG